MNFQEPTASLQSAFSNFQFPMWDPTHSAPFYKYRGKEIMWLNIFKMWNEYKTKMILVLGLWKLILSSSFNWHFKFNQTARLELSSWKELSYTTVTVSISDVELQRDKVLPRLDGSQVGHQMNACVSYWHYGWSAPWYGTPKWLLNRGDRIHLDIKGSRC